MIFPRAQKRREPIKIGVQFKKAIELIFKIAKDPNAFDILEKELRKTSKTELCENIIECGILPEIFDHDSSEEKLWAKYSDIILAISLNFLNIKSQVLRTRGDSADVHGKTKNYSLVADAKTFRLSRTAKNQKDFKIKALDDWRGKNDYAVLVSPLSQYLNRKSQIYAQAIEKNVTLISYCHLDILLEYYKDQNLQLLWETGNRLNSSLAKSNFKDSELYWKEIDRVLCEILGVDLNIIKQHKMKEYNKTEEIGDEEKKFWEKRMKKYSKLSKEEAIKRLIKAEKIEAKIKTIGAFVKCCG